MFQGLVTTLVEQRRQAKINIFEESETTVDIYAGGWQARLNALSKTLAESFANSSVAVQAASEVSLFLRRMPRKIATLNRLLVSHPGLTLNLRLLGLSLIPYSSCIITW